MNLIKLAPAHLNLLISKWKKTGIQLLSRTKAKEIKAFAVEGTIKEIVH